MCAERARRGQRGLSLIELIVFIIIVSVSIAGILSVMNVTVKSSADPLIRKQSTALAEAVLEEILTKDYSNPAGGYSETDTTNCNNRGLYDDVDDYACFDGSPATAVIRGSDTLGATAQAALSGYSATVAVQATSLGDGVVGTVTAKRITVTVTDPSNNTFSLTGYKANY
jgi:MSHA pilin protein MshD